MNSDLARLPDKALNTFCARRWGGFAGVFWEALAKRQRQKGRRGSQPPRRCPTHKRFAVEKTDKSSGGGQLKGGKRGRGDTTRNKRREPTVLDVVADRWKPASLLALSGVPGASHAERGRVRGRTPYWVAPDGKGLWDARLETKKYSARPKNLWGML
jgi:hypothetical protein